MYAGERNELSLCYVVSQQAAVEPGLVPRQASVDVGTAGGDPSLVFAVVWRGARCSVGWDG